MDNTNVYFNKDVCLNIGGRFAWVSFFLAHCSIGRGKFKYVML